jgi:hypothetical protein
MKFSTIGLSIAIACLFSVSMAQPIVAPVADVDNVASDVIPDRNMPKNTDSYVDFGTSGFLGKKRDTISVKLNSPVDLDAIKKQAKSNADLKNVLFAGDDNDDSDNGNDDDGNNNGGNKKTDYYIRTGGNNGNGGN